MSTAFYQCSYGVLNAFIFTKIIQIIQLYKLLYVNLIDFDLLFYELFKIIDEVLVFLKISCLKDL
jgi:hypothetical protein